MQISFGMNNKLGGNVNLNFVRETMQSLERDWVRSSVTLLLCFDQESTRKHKMDESTWE